MERIQKLNRYQKGILLLLIAMVVIFSAVYFSLSSQVGFVYKDAFLKKSVEGENTIYSGSIGMKTATFTVTEEKSLTFTYGDKTHGPFTAKEDPTAIPKHNGKANEMTGIEVREGDEILFRGGALFGVSGMVLVEEETGETDYGISGSGYDVNGNLLGDAKPSIYTILCVLRGPELTQRVKWPAWFGGMFLSLVTAIYILFADELFYIRMSFRVEYAEDLYPSAWEIIGRYAGWTVCTVATFVVFTSGLIVS